VYEQESIGVLQTFTRVDVPAEEVFEEQSK